ncbi:Checkpoint kinase 1 [Oopsacas minuta]|uniref:Checkpoint kinase 1 n=1 Tax=Oopsacas minuta TaxID=111878 RepID=A0AAV7JJS4_9METZ|nr:Checkpoint kinase 1 [Oopsacas minuta]
MSSTDPSTQNYSDKWFCCVCSRPSSRHEFYQELVHYCDLLFFPNNRASMHISCYTKFLKELQSTSANASEITHSIVCNHINSTTCRLDSLQCKCRPEYKKLLKFHMVRPHPYTFCVSCSSIYEIITSHANNIKSVAHTSNYNLHSQCFVPLCKEARRELTISDPSKPFISFPCQNDTANFKYNQGCYSPNKITINSITITEDNYNYPSSSSQRNFEVIQELGSGARGVVELARTLDGEYFAIKTLNEKWYFDGVPTSNEESILSSLNHSNIIKCFGGLELKNYNGIFLEYATNGTLETHIKYHNGLTSFQTLFYLRQLSSALSYLHMKSIIHRDVKSDNVLLFNAGYTCKLTDFSEAYLFSKYTGPTRYKDPRIQDKDDIHGSPMYWAPETVFGYGQLEYSDIWSLGILTCRMLSPTLPHQEGCSQLHTLLTKYRHDDQRLAVLTMNSFFSSIKNEPCYFKNELRGKFEPKFCFIFNNLFDFMLCLDATQRKTARDVLNEILSDRTYQEEFIKDFKVFDCCDECDSLPHYFDYEKHIESEYRKKVDRNFKPPNLMNYGEKCFNEIKPLRENPGDAFTISIYIHWHYWFRFKFNFRPKFHDFLIHFLMPTIGATSHNDLHLLTYNEKYSEFDHHSSQQLDTYCFSCYYCFLSDDLLDKNKVS